MKLNVPVKRRRWRMKVYEDVFVASEALDWLHGFLKDNPNFGADVNRQQAVQLCQKFLKNGILTDARGKQYNGMFEDNNHLYRFSDRARYSPYKTTLSPKGEKPLEQKTRDKGATSEDKGLNLIYKDETSTKELGQEDGSNYPKIRTPVVKSTYNLRSMGAAPSRTPLVNKMNVWSATRTEPKGRQVKSSVKRRRSQIQHSDLEDVIMNPAALVAENRRSLTEREISEVWWNIATTRYVGKSFNVQHAMFW